MHKKIINYYQSESSRLKIGRQNLRYNSRFLLMTYTLLFLCSFLIGIGVVSRNEDSQAAAITYYLSPSGNDANPCSQAQPCRTVNRGYQVAGPGDTVIMAAGSYGGQSISGTKTSPGVIFDMSAGASISNLSIGATWFEFRNGTINGYGWWGQQTNPIPSNITMRNIVSNSEIAMNGGNNISIIGGSIGGYTAPSGKPTWISVYGEANPLNNLTFDGVLFHDINHANASDHFETIRIDGPVNNLTIRNSKFINNTVNTAVLFFTKTVGTVTQSNMVIENNFFDNPSGSLPGGNAYFIINVGGNVTSCSNWAIRYNSFAHSMATMSCNTSTITWTGNMGPRAPWDPCIGTYRYNVFQWSSNHSGVLCGSNTNKVVIGAEYSANALGFTNLSTTDFHLTSTSPGIGAGDPNNYPSGDIDGHSRPVGTVDAGADEYGSGGSAPPPPPPAPAAPVVTISANPTSFQSGGSSTLTWSATNSPSSCTASGDWSGTKAASGTQGTGVLSTVKTYTYNLSCSNGGGSGSASTTVNVTAIPPAPPAKPVISLSVNPSTINQGSASTIAWSATNNPSTCTASGDWSGTKAASGTQGTGVLSTVKTYTYTLTCSNAGGSTTGSVALVVLPVKPVVSITAAPTTLKVGEASTLTWSATNSPSSCTASGDWSGTKAASGTQSTGALATKKTYTYTLTCSNAGGSGSASVAVTANTSGTTKGPKPKVRLSVSPSVIEQGQQATLAWVAEDGQNVTCKASEGWSGTKAASGTQNITPDKDGQTYTITCENENGGESASTAVSVASIKQNGTVTVNEKPVPNLKVSNPAIVGSSVAGEQQPAPKLTDPTVAAAGQNTNYFDTTKGKLTFAGLFAGLVTTLVGSLYIGRHWLRKNKGLGGPTDFISGQ